MISSLKIAIERIASSNFRSYSMSKDAKRLKKMVDRMSQKKKQQFSPVLLTKSSLSTPYTNEGDSKRLINLNKVYMEEILTMISGGTYKSQLSNLGVQITRVKMAKGLNFLHIHWITLKKDIDDEHINQVLLKALEELQAEIGSIRFTGRVPLLKFVRDKRLENESNLDEIFQSADFGKDFKPVYKSKVFTPDFVHKDKKFPEMRQNIYGLDHAKIKQSIEDKILKFKAINIEWISEEQKEKEYPVPEKLIVFTQKDFIKFYKRKRILELKMKKKLGSKYTAQDNIEYVFEDLSEEEEEDDEDYYKNFSNDEEFDDEEFGDEECEKDIR